MKIEKKFISKKKFLGILGLGLFSVISGMLFIRKKAPNASGKITMLTADGKLVEVEKSKTNRSISGSKTTNKQIKNWMNSST